MAGFSIALVLGVFYLTFLAILIGIFICMVLTYIFDSLAFYGMAKKKGLNHAFTAWIPFYHKVLFGRITGKNTLGILSAICNVLALACLLSRFENLCLRRAFRGKPCRRICVRSSHGVGRLQKRFPKIRRCFHHCKCLNAGPCPADHPVCPARKGDI